MSFLNPIIVKVFYAEKLHIQHSLLWKFEIQSDIKIIRLFQLLFSNFLAPRFQ